MLERFSEHVGRSLPRALVSDGHRWRYARVEAALGSALAEAREAIGSGKIQGSR
jgi:predicted NAD/FAD-dependent oxidoreductase